MVILLPGPNLGENYAGFTLEKMWQNYVEEGHITQVSKICLHSVL